MNRIIHNKIYRASVLFQINSLKNLERCNKKITFKNEIILKIMKFDFDYEKKRFLFF